MFTKFNAKQVLISSIVSILLLLNGCANRTEPSYTPKVSVQLWSVKDAVKSDFEGTLNKLADMGFSGVEFAGEFGKYQEDPTALKSFLDGIGLQVSGAHIPFEKLNSENFSATTRFYRALGCDTLIIPFDKRAFDDDQVDNLIADLNRLSTQLAPLGMKIGYHNHAQEFGVHKNSTFWDYIAKNTNENVVMQQDVGWTTYAGKDPIEYVKRYPGRTLTTHYKVELPEGTQGKLPLIGQDTIDWANLIDANIKVGGTKWLVVEQEAYPNGLTPLEAVKVSKNGLDSFLEAL